MIFPENTRVANLTEQLTETEEIIQFGWGTARQCGCCEGRGMHLPPDMITLLTEGPRPCDACESTGIVWHSIWS